VADLARPLHLDLEHDRHPGGETALELAAQRAIATAQAAAGVPLPDAGAAFLSVTDADKPGVFAIAQLLHDAGFEIFATRGTAQAIARMGVPASQLNKISEGSPHVLELIEAGKIHLVVNTPTGSGARSDGWEIRNAAITRGIPCLTTLAAGVSAARAIAHASSTGPAEVICLQELHRLGGEGEASSRERTLTS
jgi:carbamoyl-phosphate synthase large subunit